MFDWRNNIMKFLIFVGTIKELKEYLISWKNPR